MPGCANYGPNLRPSGFVPRIGRVPTSPKSFRSPNSSSEEDGKIFNLPSSSSFFTRRSSRLVRGDRYPSYSPSSSYSTNRNQPCAKAARSSERRTLDSRDARGSYEWHQPPTKAEGRYVSRGSHHDAHYSTPSRSRSRSPARARHPNGNLFSRTKNLLAEPDDPLLPSQVSSLLEIPPFMEYQRAPPKGCRCCVSEICQFRREDSKDCRPLVPNSRRWMKLEPQGSQIIPRLQRRMNGDERRTYTRLRRFGQHIGELKLRPRSRRIREEIRAWLAEVQLLCFKITQEVLLQSSVLTTLKDFLSEEQDAFRHSSQFPIELEEDLTCLYRKWAAGDLDNHPDRGLRIKLTKKGSEYLCLDKTWEHFRECNYFGAGNLVNGQQWPGRIHMRRDGAHGAAVAGIYGPSVTEGAQALVMGLHAQNGDYYADRDEGDRIKYIGTARKKHDSSVDAAASVDSDSDEEDGPIGPTRHTRTLMTSIKTGKPVRLFRSHKLPDINLYRPQMGFRYDGLYTVVSSELLEDERQIYGFELQRLPGQGPIRRNDMRTFEETPEQAEKRRRRKERSASSRAQIRAYT